MKLKKFLVLSYIIVMLTPILTGIFIYKGIQIYNEKVEFKEYINAENKIQKYEKKLQDTEIYTKSKKKSALIGEEDKNSVKINLYDKYGMKIYSSLNEGLTFGLDSEQLYKDLYVFQKGYRANKIKKPVLLNGDIVGFYELIVSRDNFVKATNNVTFTAFIIFALILLTVFISVIYVLNKKLTTPISILVDAMKSYAKGEENLFIEYDKKDEIGDLISHFESMKDEINENKKEIEKQQNDKEYLIAAISHDLKTPLTSIRAYAEALKEYKNLNVKDIDEYTSVIINKSDYMKNMLEDLLTYTLLTTQYKLDFVDVEGEEFVEMLFSGYDELCEANKINIIKEIKVSGNYQVDVKSMIRVVDNLLSNALRYVKSGGSIYLGAYSEEFQLPSWLGDEFIEELNKIRKDRLLIFVKNDGEAISKNEQEKIFNAFYQSDHSRNKTSKSGTGLGLSIVKIIIEKHDGKVKLLSENNFGTIIGCFIKKS